MKRPLKWTLGLSGAVLGLAGLIVGHAFYRAHRVLEEHLQSATALLETFGPEAVHRPPIFDPEEEGNAWDLEERALSASELYNPNDPEFHSEGWLPLGGTTFFLESASNSTVEKVESQVDTLVRALRRRIVRPPRRPGMFVEHAVTQAADALITSALARHLEGMDLQAAERLVLALGLAQDVSRHGDFHHWIDLVMIENRGAGAAWQILSSHALSAAELKTWATWMDRLKKSRPSLVSIIAVDSATSTKDVIEDFAGVGISASGPIPEVRMSWRDLGSKTLAKSRAVLAIDRSARMLSDQAGRPGWERPGSAAPKSRGASGFEAETRILEMDAGSELVLLLWRTAIALARSEAERGYPPKSLAELVPAYLSQEPRSPRTGKALDYPGGGAVASEPGPGCLNQIVHSEGSEPDLFRWKVGRRGR